MATESRYHFSRGVPPSEVLPVDELVKISTEVLDEQRDRVFQYAPIGRNLGDESLRRQLAARHRVDPDQIFVSNGSLQVLDLLAAHLLAGDRRTVVTEAPTYDRAPLIFQRWGGRVRSVPLHHDGLDLDALRAVVAESTPAFVYVIPDFQNPSGICLSQEKRQALVALAAEYDFTIVEDTPYRSLRYHGRDLPTLAELGGERVVSVYSLSKVLSPGLRIGYAVADAVTCRSLAATAENTYLSSSPSAQAVAARCLEYGLLDRTVERVRGVLAPRHDNAVAAVRAVLGDALMAVPDGGYFVSALIGTDLTEEEFRARAGRAGVAMTTGSAFYPDVSSRPPGRIFVRLPFQAMPTEEFTAGVAALGEVVTGRRG